MGVAFLLFPLNGQGSCWWAVAAVYNAPSALLKKHGNRMIRFFRKIRYKFIEQHKTGKYLKYAVGEIMLVVIGILLALQINNWNEARESNKKEVANLQSLKSEMKTSLEELKLDLSRILTYYEATVKVHQYIQTKPVLVDSMYLDFYKVVQFSYFFPKTSTYETFKSGNLELIKSDSLRMIITDVYESGYQRILTKVNSRRNAARILFPYYQQHFRTKLLSDKNPMTSNSYLGIPNDYEFLINDPEYETRIAEALQGRNMEIRDFGRAVELVENCIDQIDGYLKK